MNYAGRVLDRFPQIVSHLALRHLDHHITRIIVALTHHFLPVLDLVHLFHRQEDLLDDLTPAIAADFLIQVFLHLPLLAADHPQHIPFGFGSRLGIRLYLDFRLVLDLFLIGSFHYEKNFEGRSNIIKRMNTWRAIRNWIPGPSATRSMLSKESPPAR